MEGQLFEAYNFQEQIRIVERFLTELLEKKNDDFGQQRLRESICLINRNRGLVEVEKLAASACWSRKQFERNFQELVGTSPKQFMRIVRFQHTIHYKANHPETKLTDLAYTCGFFDQSHMIGEFRDFSGITPRQFFTQCEPFSDYFSE